MNDTIDLCIKRFESGQAVSTPALIRLLKELKLRRQIDRDLTQMVQNMSSRLSEVDNKRI